MPIKPEFDLTCEETSDFRSGPIYQNRAMTTLKICLLGEFELYCDDESLPRPATLKARSLLAYLVSSSSVRRDRACPREVLADLFWPDQQFPLWL